MRSASRHRVASSSWDPRFKSIPKMYDDTGDRGMLLPELWHFPICAQGWEQEGIQASHYCLPMFSYKSLTKLGGGFSIDRYHLVSCVWNRVPGSCPDTRQGIVPCCI